MRIHILAAACVAVTAACARAPLPAPAPRAIPVATGSIYIDDAPGTGTPIVFIHGNGGSSEQWRSQLDHFRGAGRRAIAIDLPGFGRSTPPADYALSTMAAAIDAAVAGAGVTHFVIVGHSYGGAVVATYVARHPDKVAGVVYLDAAASALPLTPEQKTQFGGALRANKMPVVRAWFAPMLTPSTDRVKEAVFASVEKTSVDALIAALMSLADFDAKTLVGAYHGPRLAIVAADIENPASFQKQFPDVRAVKVTGAGHWIMLDKPAEVNAALDEFMRGVPGPR
jgi:pimeloyl-ACP methyl ester carboxylesterase